VSWWPDNDTDRARTSSWVPVLVSEDGVHQFELEDLDADTRYVVEVRSRADRDAPVEVLRGSFSTAPSREEARDVKFVVVTGQDYDRRDDDVNGHRIYESMLLLRPDFFVHTGDVVYYDKGELQGRDVATARMKWQRMYALPFQRRFHLEVPSYFLKDDHDVLKDDCWPGQSFGELTFDQGVAVFREQVPSGASPYRHVRWGKHLQVWFLEGREFRSSNNAPDGPGKTILGSAQREWLARTLAQSDATFRLVVSATPIVGPDRSAKADNHSNAAFAHEGKWLRELLASQPGVAVVCGDRHWQYTSVDPETGLWEFSCGPTTDAHAGGFSADRRTEAHRYLAVRGGFLSVSVEPGLAGAEARLVMRHHDTQGAVVNEQVLLPAPETTLSPRERDRRGDEHLFAGRFDEAIADFDAFLEAEPENDAYHWRRGIAYYYAGRYEEGAAQFVRHQTVNPDDVENAAWHFLCMARATDVDKARAALLPVGPDQRDPMMEVYELYAGRATPQDVLDKASSSSQRDAIFFAHLYLGLYHDALDDTAKAREHIGLATTTHGRSHYMGRVARVHATLLERR
jgi:alkaline phosphatase D